MLTRTPFMPIQVLPRALFETLPPRLRGKVPMSNALNLGISLWDPQLLHSATLGLDPAFGHSNGDLFGFWRLAIKIRNLNQRCI